MVFAFFIRLTACLVAVVLLIVAAESGVSFIRSKANEARHADKSCVWDCKVVDSKFGFIGVRAGGARRAAAPPNFGQLRFFGQREKIWAKSVFKDVTMFIYLF